MHQAQVSKNHILKSTEEKVNALSMGSYWDHTGMQVCVHWYVVNDWNPPGCKHIVMLRYMGTGMDLDKLKK